MKNSAISHNKGINVNFIPIRTIMERLNVRRNYIYTRIIPEVGHIRKGINTYIDEDSLRLWLKNAATFSRQTVFIDRAELKAYERKLPVEFTLSKLGLVQNYARKRSALPFRSVKPFDFWDKPLIHPALVLSKQYPTEEILYREMFLQGAIKITLGRNKTMFYLEDDIPSDSRLMPAVDEVKQQIQIVPTSKGRPVEKPVNLTVNDCATDGDASEIICFFRERGIKILQFYYDREQKNLHIEFNILSESASENSNTASNNTTAPKSDLFIPQISNDDIPF